MSKKINTDSEKKQKQQKPQSLIKTQNKQQKIQLKK